LEKNIVFYWAHEIQKNIERVREKCISICLFYISSKMGGTE